MWKYGEFEEIASNLWLMGEERNFNEQKKKGNKIIIIIIRGQSVICILSVKAPSHYLYNELAQRTPSYREILGDIWHSLVYAEVRSDIVLKSLFFVFCKFVFVVVRSVWRDFSTRDNDKSREIRERSPNVLVCRHHLLSYAIICLNVVSKSLLSVF